MHDTEKLLTNIVKPLKLEPQKSENLVNLNMLVNQLKFEK